MPLVPLMVLMHVLLNKMHTYVRYVAAVVAAAVAAADAADTAAADAVPHSANTADQQRCRRPRRQRSKDRRHASNDAGDDDEDNDDPTMTTPMTNRGLRRPHAQRRRRQQGETRNPGQTTPAMHLGKKYVRTYVHRSGAPHSDIYVRMYVRTYMAIMTIMTIALMPAPTVFVLLWNYNYHAPRSLLGCEPG